MDTLAEVELDQGLVGNASFLGQILKVEFRNGVSHTTKSAGSKHVVAAQS